MSSAVRITPKLCYSPVHISLRHESHGTASSGSQFIRRLAFTLHKSFTASAFQCVLRFVPKCIYDKIHESQRYSLADVFSFTVRFTNMRLTDSMFAIPMPLVCSYTSFGGMGKDRVPLSVNKTKIILNVLQYRRIMLLYTSVTSTQRIIIIIISNDKTYKSGPSL